MTYAARPHMRVLFMSGCTDDQITREVRLIPELT
jgi:hypothetical protein